MKRLSTENRQYLGGCLAFIALIGMFAFFVTMRKSADGVYLHVFNNNPFPLTVYSVSGSDKEKLERMGEVRADGDEGFWLSDRPLEYHWRFLGKQGQVIKDVTLSAIQVSIGSKVRYHKGPREFYLMIP